MNKKQQRAENLQKHYNNLTAFYLQVTGEEISQDESKKLSSKLLKLENTAAKETAAQNNGYYIQPTPQDWQTGRAEQMRLKCTEDGEYPESDAILDEVRAKVQKLFKNKLKGLFINYDSRGHALKINDKIVKDEKYTICQDWGGYGILSPEIN